MMLRTGDLVEVRSKEDILAMLGPEGRLDRLPFMPEMLQHCGRRFRVSGVAHKTCDSATGVMGRRMHDTVFLENLRCDGSSHGGCQARCLLFWKTQWLRRVDDAPDANDAGPRPARGPRKAPCSERLLNDATNSLRPGGETRYYCQATEHWAASEPLRPLAISHFIADFRTRNAKLGELLRVVFLHLVWRLRDLPFGWKVSRWVYDRAHRLLMGRPDPFREGAIPDGAQTPTERLDLQPGEWVEVKSHDEILQTITPDLANRGLKYNVEMTPACGKRFQVAQRIERIIEEKSGRMLTFQNPCITLEGFYCRALYTSYSLLCTRRITPYFREIWLRRASSSGPAQRHA
jgi:hypothetical protein